MFVVEKNEDIEHAASAIQAGKVGLVPTDTNFALAANPWNAEPCEWLYVLKGRDRSKPLTLFLSQACDAFQYIDMRQTDRRLLERLIANYWPGPLNIVAPKSQLAPVGIAFDELTISLVCNVEPALQALIEKVGTPLALTSANISGTASDGLIDELSACTVFGDRVEFIVKAQAGELKTSISSTIVSVLGGKLRVLRQGDLVVEI
jgi:L-threonylcarbamoyladenylate synthase